MDHKFIQEQEDFIITNLDKISKCYDLDDALDYALEASANIANIIAELHREEGKQLGK